MSLRPLATRALRLVHEVEKIAPPKRKPNKRKGEISPEEAEARARAREDVDAFCEYVSGQKQAGYHRALQAAADRYRYLLVEGPPEVGKSQQLTLRRVCWLIGRNPEITIGIVGAKADQANEWVRAIGTMLESKPFRRVFPGIKRGRVWGSERLEVRRKSTTITSPTVQGIGIGGTFLGARLNLIILDDILNAINTSTREQRRKVSDWIDSSMCVGRLLAGGSLVFLANTWTSDDAMHTLAKRLGGDGEPIYHYKRDPLPDPDEPDAVSPLAEIWPVERLRERKAVIGPARYRWQYGLQPRGQEDSRFDPSWFETASPFRWSPPGVGFKCGPGERLVIGMDLGVGLKEKHDQSSWVVYVRTADNRRHVVYTEKARLTGPKLIDRMAVFEKAYPGAVFRVETVAAQKYLAQFASEKIDSPIAYHSTTATGETVTNKTWGIEQLAIRAEAGQLLFARDARGRLTPEAESLRDGLLWYSPAEHTPDDVMALLFAEAQLGAAGEWIDTDPDDLPPPSEGARLLKSEG